MNQPKAQLVLKLLAVCFLCLGLVTGIVLAIEALNK